MIPTCPGAAASSAMSGLPIPTGAASDLTQGAAPGGQARGNSGRQSIGGARRDVVNKVGEVGGQGHS
jgi:hypothetical protein